MAVVTVGCGDGSSGAGGDGGAGAAAGGGGGGEPWLLSAPIDEARPVGDREYQLYVPSGLDLNEPTPLVLSFHGSTPGDMPASVLQRGVSGGNPHAQDNGYIIVYPQGLMRGENQGWDTGPLSADIDFVDAIIADLDAEFGIDERRIYAAGISNGGAFSYTLACTRSEAFAAIAPVAGALPTDCPLVELIPAIVFHGTADDVVSYDRGSTSAEAWALRNRCSESTETVFENGDSTCEAWVDCQTAADVELCTVDGGGHTWPGSPFADIFESFGVGFTTDDLDATDRMWEFFQAHPK
ncbi:MAG: PHB depolymerase family esterase [Myxococcota bacterium]